MYYEGEYTHKYSWLNYKIFQLLTICHFKSKAIDNPINLILSNEKPRISLQHLV